MSVRIAFEKMVALLNMTGQSSRVRVLLGDNPESLFRNTAVPYRATFDASDWDERTLEFMRTGDPKSLQQKTVNGVNGYLLPAIRISVAP